MHGGVVCCPGPFVNGDRAVARLARVRWCDGARLPYFVHKPCSWRAIIDQRYSIDLVQCMCRATTASTIPTAARGRHRKRKRRQIDRGGLIFTWTLR